MEELKVKENTEKENTENAGNMGKPASRHWAIIGIAAVLMVLVGAMIFIFGGSPARELQKQLDLGQKYLEEMNYEEAVVAFQAAIEIDPMSVDAYLGLVEVYIRTGEFDTALEYAKKGYEATGDERLKKKIDMIESGNITASNGWSMKESLYDGAGVLKWYATYRYGEYGVAGISVYSADGSLLDEGEYQYDEEGRVMVMWQPGWNPWTTDGADYRGLCEDKYEYDSEGNLIAIRIYDSDGTLESYIEYEYDSEGKCIGSGNYDSDGTLWSYIEYELDSEGNCIASRVYDNDGSLNNYNEFEYDSEGNQIVSRRYDSDGTLENYTESEYDSEGNQIATRYYDGDGNLLSETRNE